MSYQGIIVHHSACPSINGKGFDFWVTSEGSVYAAPLLTDSEHIHICLEGNFDSGSAPAVGKARREQMFAAGKLIVELSGRYRIPEGAVRSHDESCPGHFFPWSELVISPGDGYH